MRKEDLPFCANGYLWSDTYGIAGTEFTELSRQEQITELSCRPHTIRSVWPMPTVERARDERRCASRDRPSEAPANSGFLFVALLVQLELHQLELDKEGIELA